MEPVSFLVMWCTLVVYFGNCNAVPIQNLGTLPTPVLTTEAIAGDLQVTEITPSEGLMQLKTHTDKEIDQGHKDKYDKPPTGGILSSSHLVQVNGTIVSRLINDSKSLTNTSRIGRNKSQEYLRGLVSIPSSDSGIREHNDSSSLQGSVEGPWAINGRMPVIHQSQAQGKQVSADKRENPEGQEMKRAHSIGMMGDNFTDSQRNSNKPGHSVTPWTNQSDPSLLATTKKPIYIRGQRLKQQSPREPEGGKRTDKKSDDIDSESIKTPASMISHYGFPSRGEKGSCWPNCDKQGHVGDNGSGEEESDPVRNKIRHINGGGNKILHYNSQENQRVKPSARVYAWILAAAMLTVGSLVSLSGGVLLCFCGEKWKKMREERRRLEKYGEYERVESVSSLVSHVTSTDLQDEQMESVSMI